MIRIALAGNPNCGKTSLFNILSGSHYKVANYPGVTVEKKTARLEILGVKDTIELIDLPGIYSLSSTSIDEQIATRALLNTPEEKPHLIICVIDAGNLERNLFLVTQLIDLQIPMILALNMVDIAAKNGITVYEQLLSQSLDLAVVPIVAKKGLGLESLKEVIAGSLEHPSISKKSFAWCKDESILSTAKSLSTNETASKGFQLLCEAVHSKDKKVIEDVANARSTLQKKGVDSYAYEATNRYAFCAEVAKRTTVRRTSSAVTFSKKLDRILTHPFVGSLIFIAVMAFIFQAIFSWSQYPSEAIEYGMKLLSDFLGSQLNDGQLKSLIIDGAVAGVGSVLVFIPQIAMLFIFLGLLEDSGYLSRAAFLMDGIMRKVGLQGRSFIPLLSSFACAIPGIMAARTIPSWADRLATILVAPLMSCSARLPIYTVMIAAFIPPTKIFGFISIQGLTLLSLYLLGILGAAFISFVLKKTILKREPAFFIMELPNIRRPSLRLVLREVWDRIVLFCKSAGSVILACTILLWFLSSYPRDLDGSNPHLDQSYAGQLGSFIEPAIRPLGFNWEMGIGIIASFAAREVFVSALATIYNVAESDEDGETKTLLTTFKEKYASGEITLASALSLMVFYVFACQCMSTLAIVRKETGSMKWVVFLFSYSLAMAYVGSFVTYQLFKI
jgi:ferrous iron transport protein B